MASLLYQDERNLPKTAEQHPTDLTYAPRVAIWTPSGAPIAAAVTLPAAGGGVLLASAVRAATVTTPSFPLGSARGVNLILALTLAGGVGSIQISINSTSGIGFTYFIDASAVITAGGVYVCQWYPGASAAAGGAVVLRKAIALAASLYAQVVHTGAANWTYSLEYELLP